MPLTVPQMAAGQRLAEEAEHRARHPASSGHDSARATAIKRLSEVSRRAHSHHLHHFQCPLLLFFLILLHFLLTCFLPSPCPSLCHPRPQGGGVESSSVLRPSPSDRARLHTRPFSAPSASQVPQGINYFHSVCEMKRKKERYYIVPFLDLIKIKIKIDILNTILLSTLPHLICLFSLRPCVVFVIVCAIL